MSITLKGAIGEVLLSQLLTDAKEAHTRWEETFTSQANPVPPHTWEDWYARFIVARLNDAQETDKLFRPRPPTEKDHYMNTAERDAYEPIPAPEDPREWGWIA